MDALWFLLYSGRFMVLTKKRPHAAIQDGKIGTAPFTTVDALDAPGRSGRFLGTPMLNETFSVIFKYRALEYYVPNFL